MKIHIIAKFFRTPKHTKGKLIEATYWLGAFRFAMRAVSFSKVASLLGVTMRESDTQSSIEQRDDIDEIKAVVQAVAKMSRNLPWDCKCLVQAAAVKKMLSRRNIESTLYLGVSKEAKLSAHAWLRVDDTVVIGEGELSNYTVVSYFT